MFRLCVLFIALIFNQGKMEKLTKRKEMRETHNMIERPSRPSFCALYIWISQPRYENELPEHKMFKWLLLLFFVFFFRLLLHSLHSLSHPKCGINGKVFMEFWKRYGTENKVKRKTNVKKTRKRTKFKKFNSKKEKERKPKCDCVRNEIAWFSGPRVSIFSSCCCKKRKKKTVCVNLSVFFMLIIYRSQWNRPDYEFHSFVLLFTFSSHWVHFLFLHSHLKFFKNMAVTLSASSTHAIHLLTHIQVKILLMNACNCTFGCNIFSLVFPLYTVYCVRARRLWAQVKCAFEAHTNGRSSRTLFQGKRWNEYWHIQHMSWFILNIFALIHAHNFHFNRSSTSIPRTTTTNNNNHSMH